MENEISKDQARCPERTLIINYRNLRIGGIETNFAKFIAYAIKKNYRVIWLTTERFYQRADFREIVDNPLVEKVYIKGKESIRWLKHDKIKFHPDERVTMISVTPLAFMQAEQIREYTKDVKSFTHLMALPHFTGSDYFAEKAFRTKLVRKKWYRFSKKIAQKLVEQDCVRGFSLKHLDYYEKEYNITIPNKEDKVLKKINFIKDYDNSYFEKKAIERKNNFTIVTCARFDFPHKEYILGLLDDYAQLKQTYEQLKLIIIGYGKDEAKVREKINQMPLHIQKDVELVGAVSPFELYSQFERGHLNVGLAGALFDGAICAIPSLCVRHYSSECQTYGFISDMQGTYLRNDPGNDIKPYIKSLIEMSDEEYIARAKKDFTRACELKTNQPEYIYEQKNTSSKPIVTGFMKLKARKLAILKAIARKLYKLQGCEEEKE